jgi:hypothetical protein
MRSSSLLLVIALGCSVPLVAACSGRALESRDPSAGSAGADESSGAGGASAGTSPGGSSPGGSSPGGSSPGGSTGEAGSSPLAGTGGMTLREPEKHRASATACDHTRATNDPGAPADGDANYVRCHSHADCTEGDNGRCSGNGHDGWQCTYDNCFADSDCSSAASGEPQLCQCEGGFRSDNNVCLPGDCRVDADCGEAGYCSPSLGPCGNYTKVAAYYCHTPDDECTDDSDCGASGASAYCAFAPTVGRWRCSTVHCVG